jgi:cell fate (sporulation/competence/biofilm development) regulator YlbF (YheA/YmcA/DUF963 family)
MTMIEEKAKDLGRAIGQSTEYQAVKRANEALGADKEAMGHLQSMERLRGEVQRLIERGERPTDDQERQLDELLGNIQGNTTYQRFVSAQENLDKLMARINEWIVEGMEKGASSRIITNF